MSRYSHTKNRYFHLKSGCAKWSCTGCQDHCTSVNKCKYDVQRKAYKEGYLAAEREYALTEDERMHMAAIMSLYAQHNFAHMSSHAIDRFESIRKKVLGE